MMVVVVKKLENNPSNSSQKCSINQNILFVASFSKQQKFLYLVRIGSSMPDPQHYGTLLICWTNYCTVLCLCVVVMCVCVLLLCFFCIYALPGPLLFQLGTPEFGPPFSLSYFHDIIIINSIIRFMHVIVFMVRIYLKQFFNAMGGLEGVLGTLDMVCRG